MNGATTSPRSCRKVPTLVAISLLSAFLVCDATEIQAIPATWSAASGIGFTHPGPLDENNGPFSVNQPTVDIAFSQVRTVDSRTLFALTTVTAFVDVNTGIEAQGVQLVDTLMNPSPPTGPPTLDVRSFNSFALNFTSGAAPMNIDLAGTIHRSGAVWTWTFAYQVEFVAGGNFFSPLTFSLVNDGGRIGDFPFSFHTILPPNTGASFHVFDFDAIGSGFAANNLETMSENRIVWSFAATPAPGPSTLAFVGVSALGWGIVAAWKARRRLSVSQR
jgi:hypothetical protein